MGGQTVESLRIRTVLRRTAGVYRQSWRELLLLGLILFVPIGLLESLTPGDGIEIDRLDDPHLIVVVMVGVLQVVVPLLGTVFYSGAVASAVARHRGQRAHGIGEIARTLPYGRLIVADFLLVAVMAAGLIALVVPGIVFGVWFALVAPVIEYEGSTVRAAFVRSRELVRGHFRQVALLIWPAIMLESALEGLSDDVVFGIFSEGFLADWIGSVAGNLVTAPVFAVIVVTLYLDLKEVEDA
jgi:hypothetical protein